MINVNPRRRCVASPGWSIPRRGVGGGRGAWRRTGADAAAHPPSAFAVRRAIRGLLRTPRDGPGTAGGRGGGRGGARRGRRRGPGEGVRGTPGRRAGDVTGTRGPRRGRVELHVSSGDPIARST